MDPAFDAFVQTFDRSTRKRKRSRIIEMPDETTCGDLDEIRTSSEITEQPLYACALPAHSKHLKELRNSETKHSKDTCGLCGIPDFYKSGTEEMKDIIKEFYDYVNEQLEFVEEIAAYRHITTKFNESIYAYDQEDCDGENGIKELTPAKTRAHFEKIMHLPQWYPLFLKKETRWQIDSLEHMKLHNFWVQDGDLVKPDLNGVKAYKMVLDMIKQTKEMSKTAPK